MELVYLGLGSNMGERLEHLRRAAGELKRHLKDVRCAPVYETRPQLEPNQNDFLNTVLCGRCALEPRELLQVILEAEQKGGRDRNTGKRYGPRTIDIDILLFGSENHSWDRGTDRELTIPHPAMHERLFVLRPLLDLEASLCDPRDGMRWAEKAAGLPDQGVRLFPEGGNLCE